MRELYEKEVCINCANEKCNKDITETRKSDVRGNEIITTTTIKCNNFAPKTRRKQVPLSWQKW